MKLYDRSYENLYSPRTVDNKVKRKAEHQINYNANISKQTAQKFTLKAAVYIINCRQLDKKLSLSAVSIISLHGKFDDLTTVYQATQILSIILHYILVDYTNWYYKFSKNLKINHGKECTSGRYRADGIENSID